MPSTGPGPAFPGGRKAYTTAMPHPATAAAVTAADAGFPALVERLKALVRIPSCSFPGFDHAEVARSAVATADWLRAVGMPVVDIITPPGVLPYVVGEDRRAGPGAPTVLLYAHHDVQPPLRREVWSSDPFDPVEREGRLYGRGAADDKAGIAVIASALAAWGGTPPVNVVVLIEGEEESGSHHMADFIAAHRARLQADALVIADLANVDTGVPSLTASLRGHVGIEIELRALRAPLHSGMWGGAVPDPVMALCRMIAGLTDERGRIRVPGILDRVRGPTADERADLGRVPYDPERFAELAGLLPGHPPLPDGATLHERLWRVPALAVNGIQAGTRGQVGNVVMDAAWARIGIRIVPDQRPEEVRDLLTAWLRTQVPDGMQLAITDASHGAPWATATGHPAFAAMRRSLAAGYGREPVTIGCGASIPFVQAMTEALGGIPALLIGVEDPACAAHAENESVHLGDLRSACRSLAAFLGHAADGW